MKNTLSVTGSRAAPDTVKELQRLVGGLREGQGQQGHQEGAARGVPRQRRANTLRELATVWHKEAQKTNNNDTYALAQYLYKEYLTRFPKEKDVYQHDLLLRRAPLQARLERRQPEVLRGGAGLHARSSSSIPSPTAKYLKDAAYAAVISWKNCLSVEDDGDDTRRRRSRSARSSRARAARRTKEGKARRRRRSRAASRSPIASRR